MVAVGHHEPARQYADAAFEDTHMDVELKHLYILAFKKGGGKGYNGRVIGSQKLFHYRRCKADAWVLSSDLKGV